MDPEQFAQFMQLQTALVQSIVNRLDQPATTERPAASMVNTVFVPNFEAFDSSNEGFRSYKMRFDNYISMKNVASNQCYCAQLLLNSIGANHFQTVSALAAPKNLAELDYDALVKLLEEHLSPKKNTLVAQNELLSNRNKNSNQLLTTSLLYEGKSQSVISFLPVNVGFQLLIFSSALNLFEDSVIMAFGKNFSKRSAPVSTKYSLKLLSSNHRPSIHAVWRDHENAFTLITLGHFKVITYFLILIDAKSKWAEIETSTSVPTSFSTIDSLQDIFARYGYPDVLVSDNASIFTSEQFREYCTQAGIFQTFIAPGHPATNGLAERSVQTLKRRLTAMYDDQSSMRHKIRDILFRYRATPLSNNTTPAENFLHLQIRIKLDAMKPPKLQKSIGPITSKRPARQLQVGDRIQAIYYKNNKSHWEPGLITKKLGRLHYLVKLDNGYTSKRHINQLRKSDVSKKVRFSENYPPPKDSRQKPSHPASAPQIPFLDNEVLDNLVLVQASKEDKDELESPPSVILNSSLDEAQIKNERSTQPLNDQLTEPPPLRRSTRLRRRPAYLQDYVT